MAISGYAVYQDAFNRRRQTTAASKRVFRSPTTLGQFLLMPHLRIPAVFGNSEVTQQMDYRLHMEGPTSSPRKKYVLIGALKEANRMGSARSTRGYVDDNARILRETSSSEHAKAQGET